MWDKIFWWCHEIVIHCTYSRLSMRNTRQDMMCDAYNVGRERVLGRMNPEGLLKGFLKGLPQWGCDSQEGSGPGRTSGGHTLIPHDPLLHRVALGLPGWVAWLQRANQHYQWLLGEVGSTNPHNSQSAPNRLSSALCFWSINASTA